MYHVSVVGAVDNPGVFLVSPSTRVSEVIKLAEIESSQLTTEFKTEQTKEQNLFQKKYQEYFSKEDKTIPTASRRMISIKRKKEEVEVDLVKFFTLGISECNPYVMDGDMIYVPAIKNQVAISGAVQKEGEFEIVEGDRISDLVELAFGLTAGAYLQKAELVRFINAAETEKMEVNLEKIIEYPDDPENLILQNADHLFVRTIPDFHEKNMVTVAGEVQFPGEYYIIENETRLLDILNKIGILDNKADLRNAFVQRPDINHDIDSEFERLKTISPQNMSFMEYSYFKQKARELTAKMSVKIDELWKSQNAENDILLKSGDFIYIPKKTKTVYISGQVKNPGFVKIDPGLSYQDYLEKAGGLLPSARKSKIRIIKANSTLWLKPHATVVIEEGDMIFVPEKPEIDYWQIAKDTLTVLSQVATLLVVIQNY